MHEALTVEAAQGRIFHNDDTPMKVLASEPGEDEKADPKTAGRTGQFTSGIVSILGAHKIALYFTGDNHAGENLAKVLKPRAEELAAPLQMCDALSRNVPKEFQILVGNRLVHGRRNFADIIEHFPAECQYVIG